MFFLLCFQGRTALHDAAENGNFKSDVIQFLLEHVCKPDEIDKEVSKKKRVVMQELHNKTYHYFNLGNTSIQ